ncbi:MAG: hypothetical protein JJU18_04390 [Oceanicaulis sp.]|nr:hypothetical protein [Oceanicaulis sp.]
MIRLTGAGFAASLLAAASAAVLEGPHEVRLSSGFMPDPHRITLEAGGPQRASDLISGAREVGGARMGEAGDQRCRGHVSEEPGVRLNYTSGSLPLIVTNAADFDTTLVMRAPDGTWYCDDDSGDGLDAQLMLENPQSGVYQIWPGAYSRRNTGRDATLLISELRANRTGYGQSARARDESDNGQPVRSAAPQNTLELSGGFIPDPAVVTVFAGGSARPDAIMGGAQPGEAGDQRCRGHLDDNPDLRLTFEAGSLPLTVTASSVADTTLIMRAPDGTWYCDDDSGDGLDAQLELEAPESGEYDIWVGTFSRARAGEEAFLSISEVGRFEDAGSGVRDSGDDDDDDFWGGFFDAWGDRGGSDSDGEAFVLDSGLPAHGGVIRASLTSLLSHEQSVRTTIRNDHRLRAQLEGVSLGEAGDQRCRGHVGASPDAHVHISGRPGDADIVIFSAEAVFDTTMAILSPDGTWYCDDDSGRGVQARLELNDPLTGAYKVWIGSYTSANEGSEAHLRVTAQ